MWKDLKERLQALPTKRIIVIVLIVIGFYVLLDLNSRLSSLYTRRQDIQQVSTEVIALYATEVYLQTQVARRDSVQQLEEFGRESGYIRPGDIPVAVIPLADADGALAALQPTPTKKPPQFQNWEVWWHLLFGN